MTNKTGVPQFSSADRAGAEIREALLHRTDAHPDHALLARLRADHERLLGAFAQVRRLAGLGDFAATQRKLFQLRSALAAHLLLEEQARHVGVLSELRAELEPLHRGLGEFLRRYSESGIGAHNLDAFAQELEPMGLALMLHVEHTEHRLGALRGHA